MYLFYFESFKTLYKRYLIPKELEEICVTSIADWELEEGFLKKVDDSEQSKDIWQSELDSAH